MKYKTFALFITHLLSFQYIIAQNTPNTQNTQNWQLSQQYTPADVCSGNLFGNAVDIDGNYAIASAHRQNHIINDDTIKQAGAVYIFEKDANGQWNEIQKLSATDAVAYDYFGIDVGLSGSTAVVGANYNSSDANNQNPMPAAGAVYVFERNENGIWEFWQKLTASDRDTLDQFGISLHICENQLLVGAPIKKDDALAVGCVYYFTKNQAGYWEEQQKIKPPNNIEHMRFGTTLHFNSNFLVVGAPLESGIHKAKFLDILQFYWHHGAAYIYELEENGLWNFSKKTLSEQKSSHNFGEAVAAITINNQSYVFVGQPNWIRYKTGEMSRYTGGVHIYTKKDTGNWYLQETLTPIFDKLYKYGRFGHSIDIDSNRLVICYLNNNQVDRTIVADILEIKGNRWEKVNDVEIPRISHFQPNNIGVSDNSILIGNSNSLYVFNHEVMSSIVEIGQKQYPLVCYDATGNQLNINKNHYAHLKNIWINSISGNLLYYKSYQNSSPDKIVFNFPPGIYLLAAVDIHNNLFTQKIIKH